MCLGLQDKMEYDKSELKGMGKLNENELACLIKEMIDTAEDFISEGVTIENPG